jgi:LmbE family N-acetylglucosaminyl deacetylase
MIGVRLDKTDPSPYKILCLGAHCDDIEIGCGGTILKLINTYQNVHVYWLVFSSSAQRKLEAEQSAAYFLKDAQAQTIVIHQFRDGFLPFHGIEVKEAFEQLKREFSPDLILTHYRDDRHQDHRLVSDLTWNTFRNHLILEYEIPKYDGDLGIPNCFVPLDESFCLRKIQYLMDAFQTQANKHWFTEETFRSLMRLRGMECNSPSQYAEAFYGRKLVL